MELENQENNTETVVEQTPAAQAATPASPEPTPAAPATEGDPASEIVADPGVTEKFMPNYKFKADKQEMEIPEKFRSLMTDADSEKEIRELFETSKGLPAVKQRIEAVVQERDTFKTQAENYRSGIETAKKHYQAYAETGNPHKLDAVWKQLGIPKEAVMQYAYAEAKLAEMDPAQRDQVLKQLSAEDKAAKLEEQNQNVESRYQQQDIEMRQMQFDNAMSTPQIQSITQEFENKFGQKGAFAVEVINAGKMAYALEGKTLSVNQAIQAVAERFGLGKNPANLPAGGQNSQAVPAQAQAAAGGAKVVNRESKTLPNVGSSGTASPLKQTKAKNLDEIKAISKKFQSGELS